MASRRNYDVGQGIGADGRARAGVFEPSWRIGGASSAELAAAAAFARDPYLQIVRASHVEEYGRDCQPPADAVVDFQGDDPEAGPPVAIHGRQAQSRRSPQLAHMPRMMELIQ